jgi:hypothetical protein
VDYLATRQRARDAFEEADRASRLIAGAACSVRDRLRRPASSVEGFNAGIVLMSRPHRFLAARTHLDEDVLVAMAPDCDPEIVRAHLAAIEAVAAGEPDAGPIAALSAPERFHWLVSPSSTIIGPSEVHTGLTADPAATLEHLFRTLVLTVVEAMDHGDLPQRSR